MPGMDVSWPPLFVSHGSPMIALEPGAAGAFLGGLLPRLGHPARKPRAVLVASAHTLAPRTTLLAAAQHAAVHDFGGFDPRLRQLRYDVAGAPELAGQALELLRAAGFEAGRVAAGGLDHGIWTVLRHLVPAADVPVLPLAWPAHESPARLLELGRALAPLVQEDVWILGSGSITHNLGRVFSRGLDASAAALPPSAESAAFCDWFAERSAAGDEAALLAWERLAPFASLMHPSTEHLLPWFIAAGAGGAPLRGVRVHRSHQYPDLGLDAYAFGSGADALA